MATVLGLLAAAFLVSSAPASAAISRTQVVTPTGDAFVSAARPRTNFGSAGELRVDGSPRERAYLRFRLPTLSGRLTRATLQVFSRTSSPKGYTTRAMSGRWGERSVTFATPVSLAPQGTASGPVGAGAYKSIDVTSLARGRTTLNVALTTGAAQGVRLASREFVGKRPSRLVLATVPFDATPPDTTIWRRPGALTRSASARFDFVSTEGGSRYECRLDAAAFAPCGSPKDYVELKDGAHTFSTRAIDAAGNPDPTPASHNWRIDTTPPGAPLITSPPAGATTRARALAVSGTAEALSGIELFERPVSRGKTTADATGRWSLPLTGLTDGDHTYTARATDPAGNTSVASSPRSVTVDATPPTITAVRPADTATDIARDALVETDFSEAMNPATLTSATFSLRRQGAGEDVPATVAYDPSTRRASLDPSTDLEPATTYTATVRGGEAGAKDAAANPLAAERTWSFSTSPAPDTTPPETTIDSGPSATTNSRSARLAFSSSEQEGSTFECRLDTAAFAACTSPKDYADLADGQHTFEVRATDGAGNVDPSPASRTWTVDATPPTITAVRPADTATDIARDALVETDFSEAMNPATLTSATFSLRRQGASEDVPAAVAYDPATRRASLDPSADLEPATTYTATVRGGEAGAKDAAANPLAAERTWSFSTSPAPDTTPPETTIDSGPSGTTNERSARLAFSSSEPGSSLECRLDTQAFAPCQSPTDYAELPDAQHTFEVRATDGAGNVDPSPASRTWTVDGTAPTASISSPPSGTTYTSAQAVQIEAAVSPDTQRVEFYDDGVLKGSEDTDPFAFTWSIGEAENGTHNWTIKAFDAAGNVSVESAPVTLVVSIAEGGGGTSRSVTASVETAPVAGSGDAADDPAVWIHPTDTSKSTIIGTEKVDGGGLVVYDLAGNQLHKYSDTKPNNVDLRYNFPLGGERVGLVAASNNQATKTLRLYKADPSTRGLEHVSARQIATGVAAGLCMYNSPTSGKYYAFVSDNSGTVQQWELFESAGKVDARKVRTIRLASTTEGCVADDETGELYISEEDVGIWKYGAEPTDGATTADRTKLDGLTGVGGNLTNDIEGLSIYYGAGGTGYLLASSQGSNDYVVYDRQSGEYVTRFSVVDGAVDGSSYTDGIDVTNFPLGGSFPEGMFVAQDNENTSPNGNQNFKLVPWGRIARGGSPALKLDTSWDPRQVGAPARNQAPTAAFGASPSSPLTGEEVTFDASASSDPDGEIDAYAWDLDDDGEFDDAEGAKATKVYDSEGSHRVAVRVTDDDGDSDEDVGAVETRDPVITAAGDIACEPPPDGSTYNFNNGLGRDRVCRQEWTARLTEQINPDAVLMLGDAQYETATESKLAASYNPSWGRFLSKTWATAGGTHDLYGGGAFYDYFGDRAGPAPYSSFSVDIGAWHVISMTSNCSNANVGGCGPGSRWHEWLKNDLAANRSKCTLAFFHEPRWSSGKHGSGAKIAPYVSVLHEAGADVILQGHDHDYERFAPQDPEGNRDDDHGLESFVVGTGGKSVDGFSSTPPPLTRIANSAAFNRTTFGVLKMTLRSDSYGYEFVPDPQQSIPSGETARFTDSGSRSCHDAPPSP